MEGVITDTPRDGTLDHLGGGIGLALDAQVHNVITANGAIVDGNV